MVHSCKQRWALNTWGTFAATSLKKYRRYFIRYIFEKVPTVPYRNSVLFKRICSYLLICCSFAHMLI